MSIAWAGSFDCTSRGTHNHVGAARPDGGQSLPLAEAHLYPQFFLSLLLGQEHIQRQMLEVSYQCACTETHDLIGSEHPN